FDIKTVKLNSAFAYIVADGFYRNEVTGENSSAAIKLRALTNLKGRSSANINLVTHLEYDRVQYLVTRKDSSVTKAKMAAEKELFAAFGINNSGFEGLAEDLNVLKEGKGNAALLAISVLLQGDRNESELTALLASLSVDLGDNGQWDNAKQRAQIADWAMKTDLNGGLPKIRANVEGWKLAESAAPAFEQHVTNFWMQELDVDKCDSSNAGALFAVKNKNSAYYAANDSAYTDGDSSLVRLICDADGAWRFATDLEKDVAALSADLTEGSAANGKINTSFVYVKENGSWRRGTELDAKFEACVNEIKNTTTFTADATDTTWYICATDGSKLGGYVIPTSWRLAKEAEADTAQFGIPETAADSIKQGHINKGRFFVFDDGVWRRGTENDYLLHKVCLDDIKGEVVKTSAGQYYTCTDEAKILSDGAIVSKTWRNSTAEEADNYFAENPDQEGAVKQGDMDKSRVYVFENGEWRRGTNLDLILGEGCIAVKEGTIRVRDNKYYYTCSTEKTVENGVEIANAWRASTAEEADIYGWSAPTSRVDSVRKGNIDHSHYYAYRNNAWVDASYYEMDTYPLSATAAVGTYSAGSVNTNLYYVKDSYGWRPATDFEKAGLGACTQTQRNNVKQSNGGTADDWYKCVNEFTTNVDTFQVEYNWRKAKDIEKDTVGWGAYSYSTGDVKNGKVNANLTYVRQNLTWRHGTALDSIFKKAGYRACTTNNDTLKTYKYNNLYYVCTAQSTPDTLRKWVPAPDLFNDTYESRSSCNENGTYGDGTIMAGRINKDKLYACQSANNFRPANSDEISYNRACVSFIDDQIYKLNGLFRRCWSGHGWERVVDKEESVMKAYGKEYKTVVIGTQQWMTENLNDSTSGSYCYNDIASYCNTYGRLYEWSTAVRVCPAGWHLPTRAEWRILFDAVGGEDYAGYLLKSASGWNNNGSSSGNGSGTYPFSVKPAGDRNLTSSGPAYSGLGKNAKFWTSTKDYENNMFYVEFSYNENNVYEDAVFSDFDFSVRCVQD
ncbi:MAG: hypothetical protein IKA48_14660, partial [Fibrobacter sp.]|nr:hypothetical protein [Fibrobacter sp.]